MIEPILLTPEQYYAVAFLFFQIGMFYTAKQIFSYPDEREQNE